MPALPGRYPDRHGRASMVSVIVVGVDRSRKVSFGRTGRKRAPMPVPDRLTAKMTAKISEAASSALPINSLEGSLMVEWE
jgi:hypothetical protein